MTMTSPRSGYDRELRVNGVDEYGGSGTVVEASCH
jgi:hypothetical protein